MIISERTVPASPFVAALLHHYLPLDAKRIEVRGRHPELDEFLNDLKHIALGYRTAREEHLPPVRKAVAEGAVVEGSSAWVAALAVCDERTVRLAASEGRLRGTKERGVWRFDRADAEAWMLTRRRD